MGRVRVLQPSVVMVIKKVIIVMRSAKRKSCNKKSISDVKVLVSAQNGEQSTRLLKCKLS
jgi:hypothetical protein